MGVISVKRRTAYLIGGGGVVLFILGVIVGWVALPMIVKNKVEETIAIRNGTEAFERWETLPVTMLFKVYIFQIINPEGMANKGEKPILQEVGPFVYRETRKKTDIKMFEKEDRAVYMQETRIEFAPDLSPVSDEKELLVLNLPAVGFALVAESVPGFRIALPLFNHMINKMWPNGPIFIKVTAREILVDGIKMICQYEKGENSLEKFLWRAMCLAYAYIRPKKNVVVDDGERGINTFSFFKYKLLDKDGPYEVKLGIKEPERIGEILKYKNKTDLAGIWGGEKCNRLAGTDSTVFKPFLHDVDTLTVYNSDICRSAKLTFERDLDFHGIPVRRYVADKNMFASVLDNPENYCFCPRSVKGLTSMNGCMKSGLLDLSSCQGAPAYISFPHFHKADPFYLQLVEGLKPNASQHEIFVDLEPNSGYPVRGAARAQMNVHLKKIPELDAMKNFQDAIVPAVWIDEGVELTDELIDEVKSRLLNLLKIADILVWVMIGVGAILTVSCILLFATGAVKRSESSK